MSPQPLPNGPPPGLDELRRRIAALERGDRPAAPVSLSTSEGETRSGLVGAVAPALHVVRTGETRAAAAVTGFVAGLLAAREGVLLWAVERTAAREAGRLLPHGLLGFGIDPARILLVEPAGAADLLWTLEEGLAARGLAGAVGELHRLPRAFDDRASRRLALRAARVRVPVFLLLHGAPAESFAAASRWAVSPRPSRLLGGFAAGLGRPAFRASLERSRDGRPGTLDLEWNPDERVLLPLPARAAGQPFPGAGPAVPADRPAAAGGGIRRAS